MCRREPRSTSSISRRGRERRLTMSGCRALLSNMADSEASKWNSGARKVTTCTSTLSIACTSPSDPRPRPPPRACASCCRTFFQFFSGQRCAGSAAVSVAALLSSAGALCVDQFHAQAALGLRSSSGHASAMVSTSSRDGDRLRPTAFRPQKCSLAQSSRTTAKMQKRPKQAPRIAVPAARTRLESCNFAKRGNPHARGKLCEAAPGANAVGARPKTVRAAHDAMHMASHQCRMRLVRAR